MPRPIKWVMSELTITYVVKCFYDYNNKWTSNPT
jgi:hypothetical protein